MAIKKTDTLGAIMTDYPEAAPLLAQSGLHCIGCHVSAYESIQDGCKAHGMNDKQLEELIKSMNKMIALFDRLPKVAFSDSAITELEARALKAKKKFVRVVQLFGEFDFEATDDKSPIDVVVNASFDKKKVVLLFDKRVERLLRGTRIDFDKAKKDFVAISERKFE